MEYNEDYLPDLLPMYYRRLFPHSLLYHWWSYGDTHLFSKREVSITLLGDVYLRYQTYDSAKAFENDLVAKKPIKIDIGAIYNQRVCDKPLGRSLIPVQKEVVFDIDMTDYDPVRTCCSGTDVCLKCWKFMVIACKIIDATLRADFGCKHILWVFSGRRGIHCWVADEHFRFLVDEHRSGVAEYIHIIRGGQNAKLVVLPTEKIHTSISRALQIIDKYFLKDIVEEQDILGDERLENFLNIIDKDLRQTFKDALVKHSTSKERWAAFEETFTDLYQKNQIPRNLRNLKEEIKLHYCYPRLDIHVTKGTNHLLKAPFCVHPKVGKISVPFNPKSVDSFDPGNVPTVSLLDKELNEYDAQTKLQEETLTGGTESSAAALTKIKDYKKTSLLKYVVVFEHFLKDLETSIKKKENAMEIM